MGIKIVTNSLGVINACLTVFLVVAGALMSYLLIRRTRFDILTQSNTMLEKAYSQQKAQLEKLERGYHAQEKRILRVEIESKRNKLKWHHAREEIRLLELAVNLAVPCLASSVEHKKEHGRIVALLAELTEFRQTAAKEMDEWEETQTATTAYIDTKQDPDEWEHKLL